MRKQLSILASFLCLTCLNSFGQTASATINEYRLDFEIHSKDKATKTLYKTVTVWKKEGLKVAIPYVIYDRSSKIKEFHCRILDKTGSTIKKFKSRDIQDESITSGSTVFDDNRVQYFNILSDNYPFTVSYEYTIEYNSLLNYPIFCPQEIYGVSVKKATLSVLVPQSMDIRYLANYSDSLAEEILEKDHISYRWKMKNLSPVWEEPWSPLSREVLPTIILAPNEFEFDGFSGKMESWQTFGKWLYSLLEPQSNLPDEEIRKVEEIVTNLDEVATKVDALYKYMQSKTRYVSVQLGIGGYQPMSVQNVVDLGYGDCKALTNYMRTLLAAADIESYYTIVGAGKNHNSFTYPSFPNAFQANHVILTVPTPDGDTIFLECTSQNNPTGYLGSFTGNRKALLIKEDGAYLINTITYDLEDYQENTLAEFTLVEDGSIDGSVQTDYIGVASEKVLYAIGKSPKDQKTFFLNRTNLAGLTLEKLDYEYQKQAIPSIREYAQFTIPNHMETNHNRIFFTPKLLQKWSVQLSEGERLNPIEIRQPVSQRDSVIINLPKGYEVEALPENLNIISEFGRYNITFKVNPKQITCYRELQLFRRQYPSEVYKDLVAFLRKVTQGNKAQIVLVRKKT